MKYVILILSLLVASYISYGQTSNLELNVTNIQKVKGDISIALFDNGEEFPGHSNCYFGINLPVTSSEFTYIFKDIPNGNYAIALYHDLDKNGELNANWIGIPKEPYGFSNDAMGKMGPPKYDDASFEIKGDMVITITLSK